MDDGVIGGAMGGAAGTVGSHVAGGDIPKDVKPAADYDVMVDWDKRLAREAPFFRRLFDEYGVRSLVDVGCGSGRHAIMFRKWEIDVVAMDPDDSMLAQARHNAEAASVALRLVRGGFGDLSELVGGPVDAVLCLGNALPHLPDRASLLVSLRDMAAVLRPGGLLVLHLLNHDRLLGQHVRTIPAVFRETPDGDHIYLRVLHYVEDGILFDFITLDKPPLRDEPHVVPTREAAADAPPLPADDPSGGWTVRSRRSRHQALPTILLSEALAETGFADVRFFGDHTGRPLDHEKDESVIVVARKPG